MTKAKEPVESYAWAYEQGRTARKAAISKDDSPHDSDTDEYKAWLKGWKFEDGI